MAAGVAHTDLLDLHDVGAEEGEKLGAGGAGLPLGEVEYSQSVQCAHRARPLSRPKWMADRWPLGCGCQIFGAPARACPCARQLVGGCKRGAASPNPSPCGERGFSAVASRLIGR